MRDGVANELQHVRRALRELRGLPSQGSVDRDSKPHERICVKRIDVADGKAGKLDLSCPVEERQNAVVERGCDRPRQSCHDKGDVKPFSDHLLIYGYELSHLRGVCLQLVHKNERSVAG